MKCEEMKRKIHSPETQTEIQDLPEMRDDVRIVLLGKTGVGKSATGNTILNREAFISEESFESVTSECQKQTAEVNNRLITVIDTPGLFDTERSHEEIKKEMVNCISMILPGPHVFLLLVPLGRFTQEESRSVKIIQEMFGENSLMHTMVLFTRGDQLRNKTIEECLGKPGSVIKNLLEECGNRYHVFNNNLTEDQTQVSLLLEKIDDMVKANGGSYYSSKIFREMQQEKHEQQMKKLMERIEELNREKDEEKERMKMMMEEERQIHEREKKKIEEEFKNREEGDRREMKEKVKQIRDEMRKERETFKNETDDLKKENKDLLIKYETQTDKLLNTIENHERERKRREDEFKEKEERYKREIQEKEKKERQIRDEIRRERDTFKIETHELKQQNEELKNENENLQSKYDTEIKRIMRELENEGQNVEERKKRETEYIEREKQYNTEIKEMKRERDTFKNETEEVKKENKDLQMKYETQTDKLMNTIENHERERKRREEEFREKEERYKKEIKEKEEKEKRMCEEMRREREECEKQRIEEKQRKEETEKKKQIYVEQCERLKSEMNEIMKEKERIEREKETIEREKEDQLEEFEKRIQEERNMREEQQKISEDKLKLMKEENKDELKRRRTEWKEEYKRKIEEMKKICPQSQDELQMIGYSRLETKYSKWTWTLRSAMMEIEKKLHNQIENELIYEIEEIELQRELKEKSEEVKNLMSEFFQKDPDADILIQWKTSFEIKIKDVQENIVRETKRKLNVILEQQYLKRKIDAQRTQHENTLLEKSKELALNLKDKINNEEILKREFDLFWEDCVKIITYSPPIKDIDIMRDVRILLSDIYKSVPVEHRRENTDIFSVTKYSDYVTLKKSSGFTGQVKNVYNGAKEKLGLILSKDDETQIRHLITDVVQETEKMIWSFNILKLGYNISYIKQLTDYIKTRITEYEEGAVNYVFKNEFFIDFVFSIFKRAEKTFTDQDRMFREVNDPVLYLEKKRNEYYSIFQKNCQGATSAAIFGEIICQKLKRPIEQSVYIQTARDLTDEIRSNCPSLNGNKLNREKHILKKLAEEEKFSAFMYYINYPKDHFKDFIIDEVSQYIRDKFSISVQPKMNQNIEVLQQKILTAAHESTEDVQVKSGDVDLWLKFFSQKLSDVLIFSVKDFSGVKHDDVDDFKLLEDVIKTELPSIISVISREFNTDTFDIKLDLNNRPDEILFDHLCQCCWVQCPFCNAICTNTIENHDGDHSVPFHRVNGIKGFYNYETQSLCTDICSKSFKSSDQWLQFNQYRKAGGDYAKWRITPDFSLLPYWKWFVCRFQKNLETYHEKTFHDKILDEWRKYTKEDAIESLDKYF